MDVEVLYDGSGDVVPKLGKMNSRGRANRKQLKACAPDGKISPTLLATLPLIRRWRALDAQLHMADQFAVATLGPTYFRSAETDIAAAEEALLLAERAVSLLTVAHADSTVQAAQVLARDSLKAQSVGDEARRLNSIIEKWSHTVEEIQAVRLAELSPAHAGKWAAETLPLLLRVSEAALNVVQHFPEITQVREVLATCLDVEAVRAGELSFDQNEASLRESLGDLYFGPVSGWDEIRAAIGWASDLRALLSAPVTLSTAQRLLSENIEVQRLEDAWNRVEKDAAEVIEWFNEPQRQVIEREFHGYIEDAVAFVGDLKASTHQIEDWAEFEAIQGELQDLGFAEVVDYCVGSTLDREVLTNTFERAMLSAWIEQVLASDARCRPVQAEERDRIVDEYRRLDGLLMGQASARVIQASNALRPSLVAGGFAIIRKEAEKKRKHRPIKTLLADSGTAAQALKPCFMMSPLSVSQFLPPSIKFDVVIYDEASQVRPCDAANALYRGNQLIVAGDNKQLPPTNFFDRSADDGSDVYEEDELDEFESVLDLARGAASIQDLPLRWHYRSRHEDLITYSNRNFYNGRLVTFPSAHISGHDIGIEFFHVPDGVYARGTSRDNQTEARRVVERVLYHADHNPDLTLGVVAFSEAQATRIQWEIEAARRNRPDLDPYFQESRLDGFFIKNLESVQGDERDIILFSIGYGRDEVGKFTMEFGPINKAGGHRRLNVAITRARNRVEVVSSVTAAEFAESQTLGVKHLRGYLDFAEHGTGALTPITSGDGEPESPFEEQVLATLREWGYEVEAQVGQAGYRIDMAIRHPERTGRWLLGVECDGAAYHSSATARDRDRLRQQVLEGLGWRLHRIWGPSWYYDRVDSEARLRRAITVALATSDERHSSTEPARAMEVELDLVDLDGLRPPWVVDYQPAKFDGLVDPPPTNSPRAPACMNEWVESVVIQEQPVHIDLLIRRLREPWRAAGLRASFRNLVTESTHSLIRKGCIKAAGSDFFTGPGERLVQVRAGDESNPDTMRTASEVSPLELQIAMLRVIDDSREIGVEELLRRVARIFGWKRTAARITEQLTQGIISLSALDLVAVESDGRCRLLQQGRELLSQNAAE